MALTDADRAYVAALLDAFAVLRLREYRGSELPEVTIQGARIGALDWLAEVTGVRVAVIAKGYSRHQCAEHCPERHTHIESSTRRWQVTGARATVVLHNVEPYMRVQGREARRLVAAGLACGYKTTVVNDMAARGWRAPEVRVQPRARVALAAVGGSVGGAGDDLPGVRAPGGGGERAAVRGAAPVQDRGARGDAARG